MRCIGCARIATSHGVISVGLGAVFGLHTRVLELAVKASGACGENDRAVPGRSLVVAVWALQCKVNR